MRKEYNFDILDEVEIGLLTEREKEIFELIKYNPNLTIPEITKTIDVSVATVNSTLRSLKQKGYIKHSEADAIRKWIVLR